MRKAIILLAAVIFAAALSGCADHSASFAGYSAGDRVVTGADRDGNYIIIKNSEDLAAYLAGTVASAESGTTAAPAATSVPDKTAVPDTVAVPDTTAVPDTVTVPGTTAVPEAVTAPDTTAAPETAATPGTANIPDTVKTPDTAKAPETTKAPVTAVPFPQTEIPQTDVYYWVSSGSVWHISETCSSLSRSTNIIKGTLAEAQAAGKERACKICIK